MMASLNNPNKMIANVIGGSGLVGNELIKQLLECNEYELIRSFARRPSGWVHPKLEEIITDFDQPESWNKMVNGHVLFSSLGTTLKTAKTKANQYKVDYSYQLEFAKAAAANEVQVCVLVSSMGADTRSSVFYSRMKGELEKSVEELGFDRLIIVRPSILDGERKENRPMEKASLKFSKFLTRFILKKYRPTPVKLLASKMIQYSLDSVKGIRIIEGDKIFA
jgi:uncharacterized protein YbjT (DUF2867 family)